MKTAHTKTQKVPPRPSALAFLQHYRKLIALTAFLAVAAFLMGGVSASTQLQGQAHERLSNTYKTVRNYLFGSPVAITQFVAGMSASGTAPFDSLDAGVGDSDIRTHDFAVYRVGYSLTPADTGVLIKLETGAFTLPGGYTGPALTQVARFDVADLPTGASGCQNISSSAVADPPPAGTSGVTANGQKLYCYQPSPVSGNNQDFRLRINGDAPNGTIVQRPIVTLSGNGNPATSSPTTLNGVVGAETFYGLPALTVKATPRWNVEKGTAHQGPQFVPGSGPNGEDGFVFGWSVGVYATGSRKGLEALSSVTLSDNFNDPDFPNARLVTWPIIVPGFSNINLTPNNCGNWNSQAFASANNYDSPFARVGDLGTSIGTQNYQVRRGGTCQVTAFDNTAKTFTATLTGTDFSLLTFPTKKGTNAAAANLINLANLDDSTNEWWVANKLILIWAPVTDIPVPPNPNTLFLTNTINLSGNSVTGQANVEPVTADNSLPLGATRTTGGTFSKVSEPMGLTYNNPFNLDYPPRDPNVTSAQHVNQLAPSQVYMARLRTVMGTESLGAGMVCDKLDNTRATFFDATDSAYVAAPVGTGEQVRDPLTGIVTRYLAGSSTTIPITWELGVGGTGTSGGTWTSFNTVGNEYNAPATTGASQATSGCSNGDATWYPSVAALLAAGHTLQEVTRVRGRYAMMPGGADLLYRIPLQMRATYAYSGTDNAPGGPFTAGQSAVGAMHSNQAFWDDGLGTLRTAADAIHIFQNEYAQISKTSTNFPIANSLVPVGTQVNYRLTVNLTTGGSEHTTDVTVWDVLPNQMSYVPGSSTFGGAPLADPVCANSGLPTALFPGGTTPAGFTACQWTLTNQTAKKVDLGATAGNLPVLNFNAAVSLTAPNGTQLLNTSFADTTGNNLSDAVYGGAGTGFRCNTGDVCSFSNWILNVSATPGILLSKTVDKTLVPTNTGFTYSLFYSAIGLPLSNVRLLDVLPYSGDGRSPATNYAGTLQLTGPIAAPAAAAGPPATAADANIIILYTSNAPANINRDPYHAGHNLAGGGTNSATTTNFCTAAQFGSANCPAGFAQVTGFMALPLAAAAPPDLPVGSLFRLNVPVQPTGNARLNVYTNDYVGDSPSLSARRPGSNIVSTTVSQPDLLIAKSASPGSVPQGQTGTFTLSVSNNTGTGVGPIDALPAPTITVTDTLPTGLTIANAAAVSGTNWNCSGSAAPSTINCVYTGPLPIGVGGAVGGPITINYTVGATATPGSVTNTGNVAMTGQTEFPTNNNSGTASVTILPTSDLSITKTNNVTTAAAGTSVTYTIVARNNGPQGVTGATVTDTFPAAISSATWTCGGGTGGGTCGAASGTGNINATVNLPNGATVTFTVTAQISQSATGTLSNTATIAVPSGTTELNATNNTATDGPDTLTQQSDLAVTKTDNATVRLQGTQTTYVIVVTNNGPSAVTGATVTDTLPAQLTGATWTCVGNGAGASCGTANGTGNVSTTVNLNSGTSATITLTATIAANFTGSLSNTATVAAPAGVTDSVTTNNTATDTTTVNPAADIQVTKTLAPSSQVNGKIVLSTTTPSGTRDIYTINPDGSGLTLIHAGAGRDENPVWSPDGSKIAFASNSFDGTTRVGVMNANGSGVTQLTFVGSNPGNEIDSPYGWSPDGSKIIFRSFRDGNFEIYVMNADGSNQTRLINNAAVDTGGTFSPDGSKIVFTSNRDGDNEIFVMNADGSGIVQLTNNTFSDTVDFSAWSPDGTKILFASNRDGNSEIYVMNSDGTGQTRLTTDAGADIQPAWSPDGTKILFTSNRDGDNDFYTMNANGSGVTSLLSNTENGEADATWLPVVAAGSTLAYTVKVTNAGPSSTDVTMTDNIPANTVFASLSSPAGWNCTTPAVGGTGTVSCSKSGVALGEMASFVVNVVVSPAALNGAVVSNTATATSSVTDPNTANNSSTVPRGISALPDLAVSIGAPLGPLTVGQTSQLPFSVTNIGGAPATGPIVVTATLPANATAPANFTSGPFTCTTAGQTVTCTAVGPLNPMAVIGGQVPLTITAATPNPAPIVVAVAPATGETNTGNNMGTGSFPVNPAGGGNVAPDLAVSIGSPVAPFQPGVQSNVSVTVQNIGTGPTTGPITVTVPVPASVTVPTNFTSGGFTCTTAAGVVTCTAPGPINPWQTNTIQVPMTPAVGTANVPVSATVATTGDSNPTNNTAGPVNFPVGGNYPDLTPSIGTLANVQFGVQSTIPITVSNVGPGATTAAITTTITLPPNTTVPASFTSGGFSCTTSGTTVTCTNAGPINAGANTVIQLPVTPGNTGPLVITATTNTTGDPNPTNNTATTTIQTLLPDVTVAIGSPQGPLTVGQTSLLPVTMTNIGGAPAQGPLTFTATIPSNTTAPASFTSGNFTCTTAGQTVTCTTPGPLAPGQSGIAQIPLTVTGPTPNPAPITVTVATVPGETNTSNNTAGPSSFPVNTGGGNPTLAPDLAVALGSPVGPFQAGVQSNVPVTVSNVGTGATTGPITVTIPVPAGVTVPGNFTSGGFSCTTAGGTVTCTSAQILPNGSAATIQVPMTPAVGTNSVTITPTVTTVGDPNASNNTATATFPVGGNFVDVATAIGQPSGALINGATVNLPVTVSNLGNTATGAVTTTIILPPNTTAPANFTSGGFTCTTAGSTVTCSNPGPLAAGASSTIQVPVTVTGTMPPVVTFVATSNTAGDVNPSNNTATAIFNLRLPDVAVSLGAPINPLIVGQTSAVPFTVSNIGGSNTVGATLTATIALPANMIAPANFTTGPFTCATAGQTITCTTNGPITPGTALTGQLPLTVIAATPNPATLTVSVPANGGETNTANNTASGSFPVGTNPGPMPPDMTVSIASPVAAFQPGVQSNVPVTVSNVGSGSTVGPITVTIPVPNGVTVPASFNSGGFACTVTGGLVTCTAGGPINPNQSATIQVPMTPAAGLNSVTVVATVGTPGDTNAGNNTAQATFLVGGAPAPDLMLGIGTIPALVVGQTSVIPVNVSNVGNGATTGPITVTITLPAGTGTPGNFTSGGFTCQGGGATVVCTAPGPINANATATIQVPVIPNAAGTLVITATGNTAGDTNAGNNTATAQAPVTDGAVGPGNPISPFGTTLSDQKPGSVLIFPVYTSSSDPTRQNTRINLTNVNTNRLAMVHLFFVSESCQVADAYVCLTANQTTSFLASDLDPGTTGYLVAVATDANGCPTNFNFLIGDEYVKFQSGHAANLGAEAIPALATALPACDQNAVTATLAFNGVNYARVPAALALDSIASRADGNDTMLIVNRIGGNLGIGAATLGSIFGILYDDAEVSVSFSFSGSCQFRSSISNNFPRTTPRFETFIPAGRTGWLKIYAQGGVTGLTGAAINFNANASASAGAFNQGHNLHALTLNDQMTYVIPVFPPNC